MARSSSDGSRQPAPRSIAGGATILVALSAAGFSAIAILVTFATRAGAPLLGVLAWRYILAALLLAVAAVASGARHGSRIGLRIALLAGFGQAVIAVLSLSALRYIPAGTLAFLFYTYPAWVTIIARVRHSEPMTAPRLFALGLSLAGIFVMIGTPGGIALHPAGVALALLSALLYAAYVPMIASLRRDLSEIETSMYISAGAALFLGAAAISREQLGLRLDGTIWLPVIVLAVFSTAVPFLMFLRGLKVLGPVRTAIVSTVEPFFTALLAAWLLSQPLTRATLVGGALIAAAVVLLQRQPGGPGSGAEHSSPRSAR